MNEDRERAVLMLIGCNRLGTVATATRFLSEYHANVEGLYAVRLGSHFGFQMMFSADPQGMEEICRSFGSALGEFTPVLVSTEECPIDRRRGSQLCELTVFCYDDVGIVSSIAGVLANEEFLVDIVSLASCRYPAPQSGTPLFVVEMKLDVPAATCLAELRRALENLAEESGWDWELEKDVSSDVNPCSMPFPPSSASERTEVRTHRNSVAVL